MDEYEKDGYIYGCTGGAWGKKDTMPLSANLQKELVENILDQKYDRDVWKNRIMELKEKTFNYELETEHLRMVKGITKKFSDYGKPVIDGKTGAHKTRKSDGGKMFAPIPGHVKLGMRLEKEGFEIVIGDRIEYIVLTSGPIEAISLKEFEANKKYDAKYYWERIITPLIEILNVCDTENIYSHYIDCWNFTERKIKNLLTKIEEEEDQDGE